MNKVSSKIGQPMQARHKSACRFVYKADIIINLLKVTCSRHDIAEKLLI
jgi:hypothetical protein